MRLLNLSPAQSRHIVIGFVEASNNRYDIDNDILRNFLSIYRMSIPSNKVSIRLTSMHPNKYITPDVCSLFPFSFIALIRLNVLYHIL